MMNADKAREFFSAYMEGTLDNGLKQAFERSLASDAQIRAEYEAFKRIYSELEVIKSDVPVPPYDLHDRIMTRLDLHLLEEKKKPAPWFGLRLKGAVTLGIATVAILGAVASLNSTGVINVASVFGGGAPKIADSFTVGMRNGQLNLAYRSSELRMLTFRIAATGEVFQRVRIDGTDQEAGKTYNCPLSNNAEHATLIEVEIQGEKNAIHIAVPGTQRVQQASGSGSINELALGIADYYGKPVVVGASVAETATWDFTRSADAISAATEALKGTERSVDERVGKVIWIQ